MAKKLGLDGAAEIEGFDGGLWEYQGRRYVVFLTHGSVMKDPTTGDWKPAVGYHSQQPQDNEPHQYFRERDDFLAKFTRVEEEPTPEAA